MRLLGCGVGEDGREGKCRKRREGDESGAGLEKHARHGMGVVTWKDEGGPDGRYACLPPPFPFSTRVSAPIANADLEP